MNIPPNQSRTGDWVDVNRNVHGFTRPKPSMDPENGTLKDCINLLLLYKPVVFTVHVSFPRGISTRLSEENYPLEAVHPQWLGTAG